MYRFLLRPRWLAFHLLVAALVVLMVNLGIWQLHRYQDRHAFNTEVRANASQPVVPIDQLVPPGGGPNESNESIEWRTVDATGTYLADEQVLIINRGQGGVAGTNIVTPLLLRDGRAVLVTRGFVPLTGTVPEPPAGEVTVVGRLRVSQPRGLGGLTDPPGERTEFQRLDIDRIAEQIDVPVIGWSLDLLQSTPPVDTAAGDPLPLPDPELSDGPHLSYMVQWWIFSLCAVVGWVFAVRRSVRTRQRAAELSGTAERTAPDSPLPVDV
jgi:surfeit locus 1 family protein